MNRSRSASPERSVRIKAIANAARMEEKRAKAAAKQREKRRKIKEELEREELKKEQERRNMLEKMTPDERVKYRVQKARQKFGFDLLN